MIRMTTTLIDLLRQKVARTNGYVFAVVLLTVGMLFITQSLWWAIPALLATFVWGAVCFVHNAAIWVDRKVKEAQADGQADR